MEKSIIILRGDGSMDVLMDVDVEGGDENTMAVTTVRGGEDARSQVLRDIKCAGMFTPTLEVTIAPVSPKLRKLLPASKTWYAAVPSEPLVWDKINSFGFAWADLEFLAAAGDLDE